MIKAGFSVTESPSILKNGPQERIQSIIDCISKELFSENPEENIEVEYFDRRKFLIRKEYLLTGRHNLEKLILEKFPELRMGSPAGEKLMLRIIHLATPDFIDLIPIEILNALNVLSKEE